MKKIRILAISGSLRNNTANTSLLRAIGNLDTENLDLELFEGLDNFPHFNPGMDENNHFVADFRSRINKSDGVIFSTPEYAFGVPGVLKNALDWIVSTGELNDKPVAVISASPLNSGGEKALDSLLLTLTALGTVKDENSSLSIPNIKSKLNAEGKITDETLTASLRAVVGNLIKQIQNKHVKNDLQQSDL